MSRSAVVSRFLCDARVQEPSAEEHLDIVVLQNSVHIVIVFSGIRAKHQSSPIISTKQHNFENAIKASVFLKLQPRISVVLVKDLFGFRIPLPHLWVASAQFLKLFFCSSIKL